MPRKTKKQMQKEREESEKKTYAFLTCFLSIIGFVIAILAKRDDKYVMHYAKQSLVVFIVAVIAGIIRAGLWFIPVIGWIINVGLGIMVFVLWLISWIYALGGEMKQVPIVGNYAEKIKI